MREMSFKQTLEYVFCQCGNKKNNLSTVKETALKMGLLPVGYPAVHITGTNGKGTAATLLAEMLRQNGIKTGLFISPHLKTPLERIQINGKNISAGQFVCAVKAVKEAQNGTLNFFEILTLAALYIFKKNKVRAAVFECGLGGLLDATNIINPALSIITSVDLDHCSILGTTLKQIAEQKAGIIKASAPVLAGKVKKEVLDVIKAKAIAEKTKILPLGAITCFKQDFNKISASFVWNKKVFKTNFISKLQNYNVVLALKAALFLGADIEICQKVCRSFKMPYRFEVAVLDKTRFMLKDGAHNPAALKDFLQNYKKSKFYNPDNTLVFAASKGHNFKELCNLVKPYFKNIVLTCPNTLRNIAQEEMLPLFKHKKVSILRDISAFSCKNYQNNIIVCGSFYLADLPLG